MIRQAMNTCDSFLTITGDAQMDIRKPITRAWLADDIQKLKELYNAGATLLRAGAALKRPSASVKKRARELGLHFPGVREVRRELKASEADPMDLTKGWLASELKPPSR
jgi:hypothetical protein